MRTIQVKAADVRRGTSWGLMLLGLVLPAVAAGADEQWVVYPGGDGPGAGKHVVLVGGDEEYRSEEGLPQLGKILSLRHGFKCTVLFPINRETGEIDPNDQTNIPGLEALQTADLMIILARFRNLPDEQMQQVDAYLKAGKPVLGLRTSTHAFLTKSKAWEHYANGYGGSQEEWRDGFGRLVLGEMWISHHGGHKSESTRGILAANAKDSPILRGLKDGDIWGDTDVYGVRLPLPGDSHTLVFGQVLTGMKPDDPPVTGKKNDPMMPVAWTKSYQLPGGKKGMAFNTTMGAATDLAREGTRRMIVNAAFTLLGLAEKIPATGADVTLVGKFKPTDYGFNGFVKGKKPADHLLTKEDSIKEESKPGPAKDAPAQDGAALLKKGARISIVGNTLGERMQHEGWLEAYLQARFPEKELRIRNLAFSADELTVRLRSEGFGSPDDWLAKNETDVIFAFFGFNESFAGEAGLEKFKQDLAGFLKHTAEQKYNGESAPRIVLFSPIAHEKLDNPNLPDGSENNHRIAIYTDAMKAVAKEHQVQVVDLFTLTQELYKKAGPLTINGIHLNAAGNKQLAQSIDQMLFGAEHPADAARLAAVQKAVADKNFYWFHRYRTTDGYSSYGGRSYLKFVNDQTNREVMFRELEILDIMTANRDKVVWAAANGKTIEADDSNTPDFIPVTTNKPGAGPNGTHLFLTGEDSITKMTLGKGIQVNLYASEEQFPELINPVQMAWDTKGRLWVAAWPTYPHWKPKEEMNDKLLILEDTDGDGRADKVKTFAGDLHNPTGFEFWNGGVLVAMAPDLIFLKDTDGDDVADTRERILHGLDSADTHHTANSFILDPGGALYFQEGVFHRTQAETPYGPVRNIDAAVWRFEPRTSKFERYVSYGFANPHGHSFDAWGRDIVHDGTGANPFDASLFSGYLPFPQKHNRPPQVYPQRTRPCPGTEIMTSPHFPDEFQGNLLVGNVIGFQGILRYKLEEAGGSFVGVEQEPMLSSSDPSFRPTDFEIGPDGALYFTDWQNPIVGHMQHNLRDPSRDRIHGRVYRVTYEGRDLVKPQPIAGEPIEKLLERLRDPDNRVRYRTRIELSGRATADVIAAVEKWIPTAKTEHDLLEALWVHQHHNVVNLKLLERLLGAKDFRARAAATHVLCYWRDRVPNVLDRLLQLAADEHPRVRLEAVRAASFFDRPEAVEIPLVAAELPSDQYLDFVRGETMLALDPIWKRALAENRDIPFKSDAGLRYLIGNLSLERLLERPKSATTYRELLRRPSVPDQIRREALAGLAKTEKRDELAVLIDILNNQGAKAEADQTVVFDLVHLFGGRRAEELALARGAIEKLALTAKQPILRQIAFAQLIETDGSVEPAWKLASRSAPALYDLVSATPWVSNPSLQGALYPQIAPLLKELPAPLAAPGATSKGTAGRFVRIELPGKGTLTLAEVEINSDGQNVARKGKATQKNTAHGGDAAKAIDGKTDPTFGAGGQTHTEENTDSPWWEVDLGEEIPIDSISIYNRGDGSLGERLKNFSLIVLDARREEVFRKEGNAAPAPKSDFTLDGGSAESKIRRAAMSALTQVRGQETATFAMLADFILHPKTPAASEGRIGPEAFAALRAAQRIPRRFWPGDQAEPLLAVLVEEIKQTPVADRTSPATLDVLEFADGLAALFPVDRAREVRKLLGELGVRVIRIGTLPERMSYDKDVIAIAAGKPVEFVLENSDFMPHNFVITQPGAMEEVGLLAEATAQQPGALERHYIPPSDKLLLASRLLQARQSQKLSFNAPTEPGIYPYVCTYPGHWRRMYGALYVVKDLDAYLANPEEYLAANALPVKDALLKDRRPRTEWKFDDLAPLVGALETGRSFGNAKQMFQAANCAGCHKLNGAGQAIGPDLAKLDAKFKPLDILREAIDPSAQINEKFQSWSFELASGKVVTGLILEETPDVVKVIENPLVKADALVIKKSEIEERAKSKVSMMPKGLLDKLTQEEILDLIAYIAARGNQDNHLFHGEGDHHHHDK